MWEEASEAGGSLRLDIFFIILVDMKMRWVLETRVEQSTELRRIPDWPH